MRYTAGQAAKAAGVATSTITNALKKGKISGSRDEHGAWSIDPAELHRVYPPVATQEVEKPSGEHHESLRFSKENSPLERLVDTLQEQIRDLREQRDRWQEEAHALRLLLPIQAQASSFSGTATPTDTPSLGQGSSAAGFWGRLLGKASF